MRCYNCGLVKKLDSRVMKGLQCLSCATADEKREAGK